MATREFQRQKAAASSAKKRDTQQKNVKLQVEERIPSTIRIGRTIEQSVIRRRRLQENPRVKEKQTKTKAKVRMLGEDLSSQKAKARANMLKPHGHQHSAVPTIFQTGESDWTAGQMSTCSM